MPWNSRSAKKHTKRANTAKKKRQWAKIANSVLKATGDESRALRTANAILKNNGKRK